MNIRIERLCSKVKSVLDEFTKCIRNSPARTSGQADARMKHSLSQTEYRCNMLAILWCLERCSKGTYRIVCTRERTQNGISQRDCEGAGRSLNLAEEFAANLVLSTQPVALFH